MTIEICHGHYVKKAAYDQLSTELAEALAVIGEIQMRVAGNATIQADVGNNDSARAWAVMADKARSVLSKHEKGS